MFYMFFYFEKTNNLKPKLCVYQSFNPQIYIVFSYKIYIYKLFKSSKCFRQQNQNKFTIYKPSKIYIYVKLRI